MARVKRCRVAGCRHVSRPTADVCERCASHNLVEVDDPAYVICRNPACGAAAEAGAPACPDCGQTLAARARVRFAWGEETVDPAQGLRIGRDGADFATPALADRLAAYPTISRRHAVLRLAEGRLVLRDLSLNGTWLNGVRVARDAEIAIERTARLVLARRVEAEITLDG